MDSAKRGPHQQGRQAGTRDGVELDGWQTAGVDNRQQLAGSGAEGTDIVQREVVELRRYSVKTNRCYQEACKVKAHWYRNLSIATGNTCCSVTSIREEVPEIVRDAPPLVKTNSGNGVLSLQETGVRAHAPLEPCPETCRPHAWTKKRQQKKTAWNMGHRPLGDGAGKPTGRFGTLDFTVSTRRKNATRETTSTLKTWLYEHRKNPYPTKGEKIMLAIITKMTLTQVSTWFANARRRLKKENKMTWSPKNKPGDEGKEAKSDVDDYSPGGDSPDEKMCKSDKELKQTDLDGTEEEPNSLQSEDKTMDCHHDLARSSLYASGTGESILTQNCNAATNPCNKDNTEDFLGLMVEKKSFQGYSEHIVSCENAEKPRIWSLAHTAGATITVDTESGNSRSMSPDCLFVRRRHSTHGLCNETRSLHSIKTQTHTECSFEEMSQSAKVYRTSTFNLQSFQLSCPYPVLGESCEYSSGVEGSERSMKTNKDVSEYRHTSFMDDNDLLRTAFRPVMRRIIHQA
ncbi:unnamed protein product [Ranitomeya imitator]|uniref:Homeobox domain-containing protein n=1 Tax=Ranitomeya imitator TaxID=111125 RepID=A0ABN9LD91_9NEOB|nr:unnamed protein product [Ranitomeya imitator]